MGTRARHKSWTLLGSALGLVLIVGLLTRLPRGPIGPARAPASKSEPSLDAPPSSDQPANVLVWIESTPPGASIVRLSDGFVLGRTPEVIEFLRSPEPVLVRFDREGFLPHTQAVSAASDGELAVVLIKSSKQRPLVRADGSAD